MEMPAMRRQARLISPIVRGVMLGMFAFYLLWNAVWLWAGRVPDSILRAFTGIPCPTTGATRSLLALVHGEWLQALLWNPFTLLYVALLACSGGLLANQALRRKRLVLSPLLARVWMASLAAGWVMKLAMGPKYW
jgi:hypothetical protein